MAKQTKKPAVGDVVLYSLQYGPARGQYRPALITNVKEDGLCDLTAFTVTGDEQLSVIQATAVYSSTPVPGTWKEK